MLLSGFQSDHLSAEPIQSSSVTSSSEKVENIPGKFVASDKNCSQWITLKIVMNDTAKKFDVKIVFTFYYRR